MKEACKSASKFGSAKPNEVISPTDETIVKLRGPVAGKYRIREFESLMIESGKMGAHFNDVAKVAKISPASVIQAMKFLQVSFSLRQTSMDHNLGE